jgi:hypothetical protein
VQVTVTAAPTPALAYADPPVRTNRRSTPARLRFAVTSIVVLTLVTGLVAAIATSQRQDATSASWQTAEPLMVTAQAIDTSLSDADTTAAASFLQGRLEPVALETRYQGDLATASADVASAAREAGSDPDVAASIRTLSVDLPVYSGIVQEANFNEREAYYPLAAAYMAEANNLMRTQILPAAAQVYGTEDNRLAGDQNQAVSKWLTALAAVAFIVLMACLVVAQRRMSRHFHRTWNVPLAIATVIALAVGIWSVVALAAQDSGVRSAQANGSRQVSTFTEARILALRSRGDDELSLLTRDVDPTYQQDYSSTSADLRRLLGSKRQASDASGSFDQRQLAAAQEALAAYVAVHQQIRNDDDSGALTDAVTLASGSGSGDLPTVSAHLNAALADGIVSSQSMFDDGTSAAASDLDGLVWAIAIGTLLVSFLVFLGFRPRIEEYR